jgi:Putative Actinobacterial Holin-X, holin superfamily III
MSQSETTPMSGKLLFSLLRDHLELVSLEWQYERQRAWRRFLIKGSGAIFLATSYIFIHVALIGALLRWGMSVGMIGLCLSLFYFVLGSLMLGFFKKHDAEAEKPFQGTREEVKRSFNWIEKYFV